MGVRELYEQRKKAQQSTRYNGVRERWISQNLEGIATKLSNQINSYVEKNNMYLTDYQNRYSTRKGTYDDPYVSDSDSWLESMQSRKSHFDMERERIMSTLNEYGSYMDRDWVNSVMETLTSSSGAQARVLEAAQGDADFWKNFADENEYNKWAQGRREYDTKWGNLSKEADFANLSKYDTSKHKEEPFFQIGKIEDDIYRLVNDDAYRTTKQADAVRSGGGSEGTRKAYGEMTDDEVATFNYVYSKYGEEKAKEYLADIEENLNRKQAERIVANFEDEGWLGKAISYPVLSIAGGLDQAVQGTAQAFSSERLPTSTMAYMNQGIIETLDGFGKELYTAGNTVGNMLPSIALSYMTGGIGGALGLGAKGVAALSAGVGNAAMGLSSGGNAYNQALAEGYDKTQARAYGVLVGASEALLQYAIGGISKLGGKFGLNAGKITAKVGLIDSALARISTKYAQSIGSEIIEEELQNFLEPAFRTIIFGEDYDLPTVEELLETAIVTALSTGVMESPNIVGGEIAARSINRDNLKDFGFVAGDIAAEVIDQNQSPGAVKYAQKVQSRLDNGKAVTGRQVTNLLALNREGVLADDKARIQKAAEDRLTELGETGNIQEIAAALTKQAAGEKLGVRERSIIKNSKYGQRVSNELNTEKIASGETSAEWVKGIGTGLVNQTEYSQFVKDETEATEPTRMGRRERALSKPESIRWPDQLDGKLPASETVAPEAETNVENAAPETEESAETAQSFVETEAPKAKLAQPQTFQQVAGKLPTEDAAETPEQAAAKLETASQKYGRQAKAMVANYEQGQDIEEYDAAFKAAYEMGKAGVTKSYLGESNLVEYLTPTQREIAYEAGEAAATGVAQRIAAKNAQGANGQTGWKKGVVRGDNISLDELQAISNDTQKIAYKLLSTYAEATGIDIVLYKSEADAEGNFQGAQGKYNWSDPGTIYIDVNAGLSNIKSVEDLARYTMLRTFAHEFTHFVEKWNPEEYNVLRKAVFDTLTERGENVDQLIQAKAEETGLEYDRASREVVAEALTDILPDAHFVETLANEHKNLFQKLIEKLKEFLSDLRAYYNSLTRNTDRGAAALKQQVGDTVRYVENIVELFDKAAVHAVETYQKTVAVTEETAVTEVTATEEVAEPVAEETATEEAPTVAEPYTSENGYTITDNAEYNSIEVKFDGKPEEAIRDALKAHKFRWNRNKGVWYGKTDRETIIAALDKAYAEQVKPPKSAETFTESFEKASREEKDEVLRAMDENMGKISHVYPTEIRGEVAQENKEGTSNGKESDNGLDNGTVHEPVLRSEETSRLLEGVEPSAVQRGGEGRRSVRDGIDEGTEDAGRDRRADGTGHVSGGSSRDRVGGDLQQLPELSAPETETETEAKAEPETEEQRKAELHEEVKQQIEQKSTVEPNGSNFVIGDSLDLPNGTKARTRANIQALRLIKQLNAEGRNATAEEQTILSKYVGWGGLADAFGKAVNDYQTRKMVYEAVPGLEAEFEELKTLLTEEEYRAARESTKNAHYTSVEVIKAMYDGLAHLGFTGGRMLEPSSGVGNFVGAMPPAMSSTVKSWTMVELDRVTGQIAKYLYPHADVRIQGFEQTNIPDGYMDVAIGNVPFGDYAIIDKKYPKAVTSAIHNYFFAKALDKVRPGGIVMFITSSYTMNGRDNAVRKYIMQRADLLGAVRLPNTAFSDNAGTPVVTDILVLKKREERTEYAGEAFESCAWQSVGNGSAYVNEYFINHPEMVLGTPTLKRGMYSANELTYDPLTDSGSLGDQIRKAMENITGRMDYKTAVSPEKANFAQERAKKRNQKLKVENGVIKAVDENGNTQEVKVDADTAARIAGAVAVRDAHTALADALQQGVIEQEVKRLRKALNQAYDSFVQKYGILHSPKNKKALSQFADRYSILSLENYNTETKKATKTDIFSKNTIAANRTAQSAENVEEGLTISINATGTVDTSLIARLTGQRVENVTRQLIDQRLVFKDKDGNLIPAVQYLSGNVRAKLREMEGLVGIDKDYINNVEALKAVVPETIPHTDIYVNPGATWVPVSVYQDFVGHILNRRNHESYRTGKRDFEVEYVPETNEYKVSINDAYALRSAQNTQVWGESGKSFATIFENMLNGRRTNVYRKDAAGNSVLDKVKTEAVAEKVEKLNEEFRNWLWSDESRRAEMQELYNESYNALVNPQYSGEGLTVNGLNSAYTIRPHQAAAVSRIINSGGNTLLAHRVGAGKTLEMAAAAMKLKQLGVIKKPMFVVPNNVVSQWGEEFKSYFPAANILVVGDEDMTPAERMTTINRIKNNDYDAVILAYTKFEKIPMSESWRSNFYNEQIENILFAMNAEKEAGRGKGFSVKQLEKKRKVLENKIKKLTDKSKDEEGAMFEDLGVDALFVDEAHNFKNLEYTTRMSNVSGLGNADGSQRAFDMYTKIRYLQKLNGGKGIVFATATPVMNSMTEMYIMQRYLQPDTMSQLGVDNFDSWAKMFGEVVNALEISPSGSGYRLKQTFSKFKNIKALQQLFCSFTDVLTEIPGLKIPKMKGGKVQIVECEQSEFQENFMKDLAERAENVKHVDPSEDNMLKITSDGRKISYSQRMIDPSLPYEETGKIYKCCENVYRVWEESKANKGTQMIFCDMATPKGKANTKAETETDEFGAEDAESAKLYDDMKARLIQMGIPEKEIAFIHDAKNDKQKSKLAEKMNDGTIRVLIGSTGKMGVGLNAQIKAVAIHHLDAPWRPGDIEQRDGRVFRQKNENAEAYKFVYVTKGSFDSRLWDILERKQKFINQIMSGEDVGNEVEDTGEVTLSAAEVKAVASGSPLIMEEVALSKEISKLESLLYAHNSSVNRAKEKIVEDQKKIAAAENYVANLKEDIKNRIDTYSDKKFAMQIGATTYTDKKEAGEALIAAATAKAEEGHYTQIGKFAGFTLNVVKTTEGIKGIVRGAQTYDFKTYPLNPTYGIGHLVSIVEGFETRLAGWETALTEAEGDLATQQKLAAATFDQADKLKEKRMRYQEIMDILNPPTEQAMDEDEIEQEQAREQHQDRTQSLSDRDILEMAANEIDVGKLNADEQRSLDTFKNRLSHLYDLQTKRVEEGRLYKEQQFGQKVDRAAAAETKNRMAELDRQIKQASAAVLEVEQTTVLQGVLQKARVIVTKQERAHGEELHKRYVARQKENVAVRKYRERITKDVADMTSWALHPDGKDALKHIPDALKTPVLSFLTNINFASKQQLRGGQPTKADAAFVERLEALQTAMKGNQGKDLEELYSGYNDLPPDFMDNLEKLVSTANAIVRKNSGRFDINAMSSAELNELSKVVKTLKHFIKTFNNFHANAMFQHVYEAADNTIETLQVMKPAEHNALGNALLWQQIRPAYAFERFGDGGKAIYDGFRRGQAQLAFHTKEIQEFAEAAYTAEEVKSWEKEVKTIELSWGKAKLTVAQMMGFYELSKQEDSMRHILQGGLRVATFKNGKEVISDVGHPLTTGDVATIVGTLTDRQKEVADKLQQYMAKVGGKWGNTVSMVRFGEEMFGNPHYYPINSDGRILPAEADEMPNQASLYALLNMGFTKSRQKGANNRIVLFSIFDVFSNHMASMAQYSSFALPILDALKWFNYKQIVLDEDNKKHIIGSVRDAMAKAYGTPEEKSGRQRKSYAEAFVTNIIKAYNGTEAQGAPNDRIGMKVLHTYNQAQVAFNLGSVIQQPLAITRAALLLDQKSILKGAVTRNDIEEMQKYSGIAAWKSLGFYDVNISRGVSSIIKHDETLRDKIADKGMWLAEKADEWAWGKIWNASKAEVTAKKCLKPGDAGFMDAVVVLFEDVIYKTQVVDSVLTKTEFMRDKGFFARMLGSFMSEPVTTASMALNAYDQFYRDMQRGVSRREAWLKHRGFIGRTTYVFALGAVLNAAVQALRDAWRDDDDYQTFGQKYWEAFGGNLIDELSPINKLPVGKEIWEFAKGIAEAGGIDVYGQMSSVPFAEVGEKIMQGAQIIMDKVSGEDTNYTWWGGIYKLLQAASGLTGLPMASATREITAAWNNVIGYMAPSLKIKTYESSDLSKIKYSFMDGYMTASEAVEAMISAGIETSTITSQIGTWYRDLEIPRDKANELLKEYTGLSDKEITKKLNEWSAKVVTGISYDDIKAEFMAGNLTAVRAKQMYMLYGGLSEEDAMEKVELLQFVKAHPETDGISSAAVKKYKTECEKLGIKATVYYNTWKRKNSANSAKEVRDYINGLDIPQSHKRKLLSIFG